MSSTLTDKLSLDANFLLALQATFLGHQNFSQATTALATDLAVKLDIERVSIGLLEQAQVNIKAISHTAEVQANSETTKLLSAAMDESVEQSLTVTYPQQSNIQPCVVLAHKKLARSTGNHLCTIPLIDQGKVFGAMTIERHDNITFNTEEIAHLENMTALLSPVVNLKWENSHPWSAGLHKSLLDVKKQLFSSTKLKLAVYALSLALFATLFVPINYNVSAPARLEGSIQRVLVAPENGFLQEAYVRPGDKVKAGTTLVTLADEDLLLEKKRWESELAQYENAYSASLAQSDYVQMSMNQSKAEAARSQLSLIKEKLTRSHIAAPFDGVIIQGDLLQSLGAPIKRGDILLSMSPSASFRLMVEVDERDISSIKLDQLGQVALVSLPGEKIAFEVARITPVATTKDGRNFFEVEAAVTANSKLSLRPGLEGVAKINAGKRPLIKTLTHRITDWLRMTLWSWGL